VETACAALETALAGEYGGDELRVGMPSSVKVADNSIDVERGAAVGDGQGVAVVFQEKPAGDAAGTGQSRAAPWPRSALLGRRFDLAITYRRIGWAARR